jgi:hypothetical protein
MITVTGTEALTRRLLEIGQDAPKAATRAVNKTVTGLKTAATRLVGRELGVTRVTLVGTKEKRTDFFTVTKATYTNQVGVLGVSTRRLPLILFSARETSTGVTYRLPGGRGHLPGAFLATMQSGHTGVYRRARPSVRQSAGRPGTSFNLPIDEAFGPSPGAVIRRHETEMQQLGQTLLEKNMAHEIDWILQQRVAAGDE